MAARDKLGPTIGWALTILLILLLCLGNYFPGRIFSTSAQNGLIKPLCRMIVMLGCALLIGMALEAAGVVARLGHYLSPMTRLGNLSPVSAAAFVSSFVSGILSNALLMESLESKKLSKRELTFSYLTNNGLPSFFVHLPTTAFVVVSLAGSAGVLYMLINFVAALSRTLIALTLSRLFLKRNGECDEKPGSEDSAKMSFDRIGHKIWPRFKLRFPAVVLYSVPAYAVVYFLSENNYFTQFRYLVTSWVSSEILSVEAVGLIMFSMAMEFTSGMAAAGAVLQTSALTLKQTVMALIVGSVISAPITAIRHQWPALVGIFSFSLGSQLMIISQVFKIVTLLGVLGLYYVFF